MINCVKRAIIIAAGSGKRMQPVTYDIPKPLIKIRGKRMIGSLIEALHYNGIAEIYVVVGYLKEQFQCLLDEYEGITLIENPYYDSCNNIASLYVAREYLGECIIMDGDQMIFNPDILKPNFERSGYCSAWTDEETSEWLQSVKDGIVKSCSREGGRHGWQLFSVSFWSAEDGLRLRRHLEIEFEERQNKEIYWDDVALFCYPEDYRLGIREIKREDIVEIDTFDELVKMDIRYQGYEYHHKNEEGDKQCIDRKRTVNGSN